MKKDTSQLIEELSKFSSFKEFFDNNQQIIEEICLSDYLKELIESKSLNKAEIIEGAEMSEVYAYQIISGIKKHPQREKVLCLAFGMKLSFKETQDLLKKTGYAQLYAKNPFDSVIIYGLCKGLSIIEVNNLLFEYGQETLG
ncbi:MAG: hypothetical protein ACI4IG_00110 [Eubacterium sp.]